MRSMRKQMIPIYMKSLIQAKANVTFHLSFFFFFWVTYEMKCTNLDPSSRPYFIKNLFSPSAFQIKNSFLRIHDWHVFVNYVPTRLQLVWMKKGATVWYQMYTHCSSRVMGESLQTKKKFSCATEHLRFGSIIQSGMIDLNSYTHPCCHGNHKALWQCHVSNGCIPTFQLGYTWFGRAMTWSNPINAEWDILAQPTISHVPRTSRKRIT